MLSSSYRITDLLQAVIQGDLSGLMDSVTPHNVNYTDPQYRLSLVMWAVALGRLPTTELLLSRGASLSQVDRYGFTILHRAVWSADIATAHMVLFTSPLPNTAAAAAATGGGGEAAGSAAATAVAESTDTAEVPRQVLPVRNWRPGAQRLVNAVHAATGRTPLMLAAVRGNTDMVRFLLENCGADPFQRDHNNFAAIDLAALCGHVSMVRLFLQLSVGCNGDSCGDGAAFAFPSTQQSAEDYCEVAQTLPQRQRLRAVNVVLNAHLSEASRVAAA